MLITFINHIIFQTLVLFGIKVYITKPHNLSNKIVIKPTIKNYDYVYVHITLVV